MSQFIQDQPASIHGNGESAGSVGSSVSEITDEAQAWVCDAAATVKDVITTRPVLALGTALAAGVFLGWLIKRR
jgi:ElaB/YqjD/DUF883 family membrane-anchored ribosome-binding protein